MAHAYDLAGPKAKEILWKSFEVKLHKFMTAKNIPESGFYTKQYPQDAVDGAADDVHSDCEMLSELSATDTIDMVDNDDVDDDNPNSKLEVLKDACVEILKIQPPITEEHEEMGPPEEEDMVS